MQEGLMRNLLADKEGFAAYRIPAVVQETMEGSAADRAGLAHGDSIVAVNGEAIQVLVTFARILTPIVARRFSWTITDRGYCKVLRHKLIPLERWVFTRWALPRFIGR